MEHKANLTSENDTELNDIEAYFTGFWLTDFSNFSSYLYHHLGQLNWVGFYFFVKDQLQLGPFNGKPACMQIKVGHGVCGTSFLKKEILVVDDVESFPGHIRCDSASKSELVLPLIIDDICIGVLDLDSPELKRFSQQDVVVVQRALEKLMKSSGQQVKNLFKAF